MKEGDYAMIYGYPGSTNRYETSYGVKQKIDINNPTLVKLRDMRLKYMFAEMKKDPAIKLQLASSYAIIANYWKFFDGETNNLLSMMCMDKRKKLKRHSQHGQKGKLNMKTFLLNGKRLMILAALFKEPGVHE